MLSGNSLPRPKPWHANLDTGRAEAQPARRHAATTPAPSERAAAQVRRGAAGVAGPINVDLCAASPTAVTEIRLHHGQALQVQDLVREDVL